MGSSEDAVNYDIPADKYLPLSAGKTFWDEGQYENIVKRLENGRR